VQLKRVGEKWLEYLTKVPNMVTYYSPSREQDGRQLPLAGSPRPRLSIKYILEDDEEPQSEAKAASVLDEFGSRSFQPSARSARDGVLIDFEQSTPARLVSWGRLYKIAVATLAVMVVVLGVYLVSIAHLHPLPTS
jgi:hypothetical protein